MRQVDKQYYEVSTINDCADYNPNWMLQLSEFL